MKRALLSFILLLTFARPSFAGDSSPDSSLPFDDLGLGGGTAESGTYNSNDAFSFDVHFTYKTYNAIGVSFWLEASTAIAGSLSITGVTYGTTFADPTTPGPNPTFFDSGSGASPGYLAEGHDLGSTINDFANVPGPSTYFVAHITFAITDAPPGTFDIASTVTIPRVSMGLSFSDTPFGQHSIFQEHYAITIVPEPATVSLLGLGATGLMAMLARRRKRAADALSS